MEKIFYTNPFTFSSSEEAVKYILHRYFHLSNAEITHTENGKPYLQSVDGLFFSITHTKSKLFIAFSDRNVGMDAEEETRPFPPSALLSKFPIEERMEIQTTEDFLLHWTVKESAVKWLGGTLAHDFKKLTYVKEVLFYNGLEIPILITHQKIAGHILSICSERDFCNAEVILL